MIVSDVPLVSEKKVKMPGDLAAAREPLRRVARYQRWVLLALLVNIVLTGLAVPSRLGAVALPPYLASILGWIQLPVGIGMTVAVVLLAKQFWHMALAVICGILVWIPFVSLLTLLVVNQKGTKYLQSYGVRVGLLGTDYRSI